MKISRSLIFAMVLVALSPQVRGLENHQHQHAEEVEEIVVQATRSRRRVQDEAIRVEVLSGEEIEEKLLMRPGNISMMLNETGGLRVQVTSPALGSANVRIDCVALNHGGEAGLYDIGNLRSCAPNVTTEVPLPAAGWLLLGGLGGLVAMRRRYTA